MGVLRQLTAAVTGQNTDRFPPERLYITMTKHFGSNEGPLIQEVPGNSQILAIEGASREMPEAGIVEEENKILARDQFNEVVSGGVGRKQ